MSGSDFIPGTTYRKHPIIVPEHENPAGYKPSDLRLKSARLLKPFTFNRPGPPKHGRPLFSSFPPEMRQRMLVRFEERLDYWTQVRGSRPRPGEWLYAKIVQGIEVGFRSFVMHPELARACAKWRCRVWLLRRRILKGDHIALYGYKPKSKRSKGVRAASTLGEV